MDILDKVAEAYYGGMGDRFARKTRERIHWICSKVQGKHVLDVGCSQGIAEILLAREGKRVVGIDIEEESIAYAKNAILNECDAIKRSVEYRACSIFEFESDHQFETVILAEVMEHFSSALFLLEKVSNLLIEDGVLIVTVPFGINDFIDHKKTYYLFNLLEEIEAYFKVSEVKFFGKWLGLVAHKEALPQDGSSSFSREHVKQLEDSFYIVERELVDNAEMLTNQIKKLNTQLAENLTIINQLRQETVQLKYVNEEQKEQNEQLKHVNEGLKVQYSTIEARCTKKGQDYENITTMESEITKYKQKITELEQTVESKNKEILNRLDSEEITLKQYKNAIFEYNQSEAKYANVSKKYDLLSKAKLGRLTLKYWKFRKRIPQEF